MKRLLLLSIAIVGGMFTSCTKMLLKDELKMATLSVKISPSQIESRAGESDPVGANSTSTLNDGVIFICDGVSGNVVNAVSLVKEEVLGAGQKILSVASSSKVYVVANIGATEVAALTTKPYPVTNVSAINTRFLAMESTNPNASDYKVATLANSDGQAAAIVVGTGTGKPDGANENEASVSVSVSPVYSRLEIAKISTPATSAITAFDVAGIYVDSYYPNYTYGGSTNGTIFENAQNTEFSSYNDLMKIEGSYTASGSPLSATPSLDKTWGFNVPSSTPAKLIIKLINVEGTKDGMPIPTGSIFYLTVTGYNNNAVTSFERGTVYRIANLEFEENNLSVSPSPINIDLWVNVAILEWKVVDITADL